MISYYCIFVKLQTINSCWFIFQAGAIAEEVLASIRTVVAFGGQKKEVPSFICVQNVLMMLQLTFLSKIVGEILLRAKRCKEELNCQRYIEHSPHLKVEYNVFFFASGTIGQSSMGLMFGLIYCAYGLGFWYGNKLIQDHRWGLMLFVDCKEIFLSREEPEYLPCVTECFHLNDTNSGLRNSAMRWIFSIFCLD